MKSAATGGENGLLKQLTKGLLERAMQAEMTEHLGYEKHDQAGKNSGNSRNGKTTKALKGEFGELPLETPRGRNGTFEPKIVAKGQTRFTGFDDGRYLSSRLATAVARHGACYSPE
jgi:transposase-like protein